MQNIFQQQKNSKKIFKKKITKNFFSKKNSEPWIESCERPLMRYESPLVPSSIDFCPFEDVLGIGSKSGFNSIIVPGSGEPNPDSWQYNPFQTKKQRAEIEVRMLLEKCPPETIALDQNILAKLDTDRIAGT